MTLLFNGLYADFKRHDQYRSMAEEIKMLSDVVKQLREEQGALRKEILELRTRIHELTGTRVPKKPAIGSLPEKPPSQDSLCAVDDLSACFIDYDQSAVPMAVWDKEQDSVRMY